MVASTDWVLILILPIIVLPRFNRCDVPAISCAIRKIVYVLLPIPNTTFSINTKKLRANSGTVINFRKCQAYKFTEVEMIVHFESDHHQITVHRHVNITQARTFQSNNIQNIQLLAWDSWTVFLMHPSLYLRWYTKCVGITKIDYVEKGYCRQEKKFRREECLTSKMKYFQIFQAIKVHMSWNRESSVLKNWHINLRFEKDSTFLPLNSIILNSWASVG